MGGFSLFHLLILAILCLVFLIVPAAAVVLVVWLVRRSK
jgi:hypothetical protein